MHNSLIRLTLILILLSAIISVGVTYCYQKMVSPRPILGFEYRSPQSTLARVDFNYGNGKGWAEADRVRWKLVGTTEEWIPEEIMLSRRVPKQVKLNLDPVNGTFEIRNMRIKYADESGNESVFSTEDLAPLSDSSAYQFDGDLVQIKMDGTKVPSLRIQTGNHMKAWKHRGVRGEITRLFFSCWILLFFSSLAVIGPVALRPGDNGQ